MRDMGIRVFMKNELLVCRDELNWLMRCHHYAVNNYPEEYWPAMPLPVSPKYGENMCKREKMDGKGTLPPTLKIIIQTQYPLQV